MRNLIRGIALVALSSCSDLPTSPAPEFAALTSTVSEVIPVAITAFIPCANGGAGEEVIVTGNLHVLTQVTINAAGGFRFKSQFQPQGVRGYGSITGDKYQGTGVSQEMATLSQGETSTVVNNFRMIGQGAGNNFLVHQVIHLTMNANGVITATAVNTTADCQ